MANFCLHAVLHLPFAKSALTANWKATAAKYTLKVRQINAEMKELEKKKFVYVFVCMCMKCYFKLDKNIQRGLYEARTEL